MSDHGLCFHKPDVCAGTPCPFHSPSDHHMRDWKMVLRENGLIERICPDHGVGHPDPDSADYFYSLGHDCIGIHGCCGCCAKPKKKKMTTAELKKRLEEILETNPIIDEESYIDAVSCGNADDTYAVGFSQGRSDLAKELLELLP